MPMVRLNFLWVFKFDHTIFYDFCSKRLILETYSQLYTCVLWARLRKIWQYYTAKK